MKVTSRHSAGGVALLVLAACQSPSPAPPQAAAASDTSGLGPIEQVDLGAVTCGQAIADEKLLNSTLLWADGYAHGRIGRPRTLGRDVMDHKPGLLAQCQRDPSRRVVDVVAQLNRRR